MTAPDDLSGLGELTPPVQYVGDDIEPGVRAYYEQLLQHVRDVSHRLFFLAMLSQGLDHEDPEHLEIVVAVGQEATDVTAALSDDAKTLLINILTQQLASSAKMLMSMGWAPKQESWDNPTYLAQMVKITGMPVEDLKLLVEKAKDWRAESSGPPQEPGAAHQPPA